MMVQNALALRVSCVNRAPVGSAPKPPCPSPAQQDAWTGSSIEMSDIIVERSIVIECIGGRLWPPPHDRWTRPRNPSIDPTAQSANHASETLVRWVCCWFGRSGGVGRPFDSRPLRMIRGTRVHDNA